MRVKTGELKARLSHYVRWVRTSGEAIEVCVREQPVACLCALPAAPRPDAAQERELRKRLASVGLVLAQRPVGPGPPPAVEASVAGDGRTEVETVETIRSERDW